MKDQHKILVIDDELSICKGCQRIFEEEGHTIKFALSGREGLEHVDTEVFDVAIIDLKMPDIDGIEVMKSIKEKQPAMAMVMITGYASVPTAVEAIKVGAEDFIPKPFTPDEILTVVNKVLQRLPENSELQVVQDAPEPGAEPEIPEAFETQEDLDSFVELEEDREDVAWVTREAAEEAVPGEPGFTGEVYIEKSHVLAALNRAMVDVDFFMAFLDPGLRTGLLRDSCINREAEAAILCGDIRWFEEHIGPLTCEQKEFLMQRMCVEAW